MRLVLEQTQASGQTKNSRWRQNALALLYTCMVVSSASVSEAFAQSNNTKSQPVQSVSARDLGQTMNAHLAGIKIHKDPNSSTGVYIPVDLDDALKELDSMLPEAAKTDITAVEKSDMILYHHGFGTWLRNNWGLWQHSRLAKYFNSVGIHHPDDISGTIFDAYWSKLHGQSEDIAKQAGKYKEYWEKSKPVVELTAKVPPSVDTLELLNSSGKTVNLSQLIQTADVTVVALCSTDIESPKLITALDQLRASYPAGHVALVAVTDDTTCSATAGKCVSLRDSVSGSLIQAVRHWLDLDDIRIPQTLVIKRDGTLVARLNGFDDKQHTNLQPTIDKCLKDQRTQP